MHFTGASSRSGSLWQGKGNQCAVQRSEMKSFARSNVQMKFNIDEKKGVKISGGKTQLLLVLQLHLIPHHFAGQAKRKASERERERESRKNANRTLYKSVTHRRRLRHVPPASVSSSPLLLLLLLLLRDLVAAIASVAFASFWRTGRTQSWRICHLAMATATRTTATIHPVPKLTLSRTDAPSLQLDYDSPFSHLPTYLPAPPPVLARLLKLHHAIWLTSERRANTSRFPVNIDNANCPFLSQIA